MDDIIKTIKETKKYELDKRKGDYDDNTMNYISINVEYIEKENITKLKCKKCDYEPEQKLECDFMLCSECNEFNGTCLIDEKIQDMCESFDIEIEEEKQIKYYDTDDSVLCKMKVGNYYGVMLGWILYEPNELSSSPHDDFTIYYYLYVDKERRDELYENYESSKLIYSK